MQESDQGSAGALAGLLVNQADALGLEVGKSSLQIVHQQRDVLDATAPEGEGAQVRIGSENEAEQLSGVSVVACRYGVGPDGGIVAVIGPTRMDYTKAISAVRIASRTLGGE